MTADVAALVAVAAEYEVPVAQVAADLRDAANWIRRGWCAGTFYDPRGGGKVCISGGIAAAVYGALPVTGTHDPRFNSALLGPAGHDRWQAAEAAVTDYLRRNDLLRPDDGVDELSTWNDLRCPSGTRAAEVLEAAAAEIEQALGVHHVDTR